MEIFTVKDYMLFKENGILNDMMLHDISKEYKQKSNDKKIINNKHDKVFRKILEDSREAQELINRIIKSNNKIDSQEIEIYNSSYVSDKFKNSESDIVYKMKNKDVFFFNRTSVLCRLFNAT